MYPENIQEENKDWNTDNQAPRTDKLLGNNQNNERKEDRQMCHTRHKLRVQEVCFNHMNNNYHNYNIDYISNSTHRISDEA